MGAGILIGAVAAGVAVLFMLFHRRLNQLLLKLGLHVSATELLLLPSRRQITSHQQAAVQLQEHHTPVRSGLLGGLVVGVLGVLVPPTMFWGEYEIQTLADPSKPLPHIWPQGGVYGLAPFLGGTYTTGDLPLNVKLVSLT